MKIIWTTEAKKSYMENLKYLEKVWSYKEIDNFINKVNNQIEELKRFPTKGNYDKVWKRRKVPITGPIVMYYFKDEGNLIISYFWNNCRKPKE